MTERRQISSHHEFLISAVLVLITAVLYWPVRHHEFIDYDDSLYVYENSHVLQGLSKEGIVWAFGWLAGEHTYWHPVTWLSHMLDCQWFGPNAGAHHLVNVFFHCANAALLFLVLRRMTGDCWRSAMVAALFAWHPLQVDTVAWIAERKNVLSTCLWLLTLLAYWKYVQRPDVRRYVMVFVCFAVGLMAKPMLVTLPAVLLLLDFWPLRRFQVAGMLSNPQPATRNLQPVTRLLLEKMPLLALSVASAMITVAGHVRLKSITLGDQLPLTARLANALVSYFRYIRKMIWPGDLAVFYPHPGLWPAWQVIGAGAFLVALAVLVACSVRRRPYLLVGWLWFLGTLVPAIGLVQAGLQAMADRFAYVPLIGLFIAITWGVCESVPCWRWRPLLLGLMASVAITSCLFVTRIQLGYWKTTESLFRHAVAVTKRNYMALENVGACAAKRGDNEAAITYFVQSLQIKPNSVMAHFNLGLSLAMKREPGGAVAHYREALRLEPDHTKALNNLAWILATSPEAQYRNGPEAVKLAERATALTTNQDAPTLDTLAAAYAEAGQFEDAVKAIQRAIKLAEGDMARRSEAETASLKESAAEYRRRLELYRAGKPWRE